VRDFIKGRLAFAARSAPHREAGFSATRLTFDSHDRDAF